MRVREDNPSRQMPAVSVLVVTFNSKKHLPRLKAALERQTAAHDLWVLDNASAPEQRPHVEDLPAGATMVQLEENLGFAAANNRLVAGCSTEYVALLNPDAFPEPAWLEELLRGADRHPDAAAFGSTQLQAGNETLLDGAGDAYHAFGFSWRTNYGRARNAAPLTERETFSVCAAAALYRRGAWPDVGGFDESFFCFKEDVDLGFRLRLRGHAAMQIPQAIVAHVGGASAPSEFAAMHNARNGMWVFVKNMPGMLFWLLAPAHAAITTWFYLRSFVRSDGAAYRRGIRAGLAGLPPVWAARRGVQQSRTASLGAICRAMTWLPR
jgi:N-acetylglucosaminyl-diphospho-decaprenol L-rhamnosyltransferase